MKNRKVDSTAINFAMNFLMKISGTALSFLSYPYVFRVLGADRLGKVAFATSIFNLFSMLATIGIPTYGIRECAKVRDDPRTLIKTAEDLLLIQSIVSSVSSALLIGLVFCVPKLKDEPALFFIQGIAVLFQAIQTDWFYAAQEQYRYLAIRTTSIKIFATLLILCLVREASDYLIYASLLVIPTITANCINFFSIYHKYRWQIPSPARAIRHIRPSLIFFAQTIAITVYTSIDSTMIGFFYEEYYVGLYDIAIKIKLVLSYLVCSLGTVLLPKMSHYLHTNQRKRFYDSVSSSISISILLALPLMIVFGILAEDSTALISGTVYTDTVIALRVLLPTVLLIGLSNLTSMEMLVPLGKERCAMISYTIGAILNTIFNFILIPSYCLLGAAVATLITELVVLIIQCFYLRDMLFLVLPTSNIIPIVIAATLSIPVLYLTSHMFAIQAVRVCIGGVCYVLCYIVLLYFLKEPNVIQFLTEGKTFLKKFL